MKIALLRHGPTEWNAIARIQGHTDVGLSEEGFAKMARVRLPVDFEHARLYASPLLRARQTAEALDAGQPNLDTRLMERNWGRWEGLTRAEAAARDGSDCFARAGKGTTFRPPGGESSGELMTRVAAFFVSLAEVQEDAVAITHLGVIRAAYSLAIGRIMETLMPEDLDTTKILVLTLNRDGQPKIAEINREFASRA